LQEPGDVQHYLNDYGDSWELTLRLEEVLPGSADSPTATVVDGRHAAPPEDCGGLTNAESLAEVLDDLTRFGLDEINQALRAPYFILHEHGVDHRIWPTDKPTDVAAASEVVPAMGDWIGANNRELHAGPLLGFRQTLQSMGLLRTRKGTLVLTRAGAAAQRDPSKLWNHLALRLLPGNDDTFETDATLLLLVYAGTSTNSDLPLDQIATALTELGWRHHDGRTLNGYELYRLPAFDVLINVSDQPVPRGDRRRISSAAATLARAALCHQRGD
jgi:hypothetical protein